MRSHLRWVLTLAAFSLPSVSVPAQSPPSLAGSYNGGQTELATELQLEANGRFEYYLSYGALDEMAEGTWTSDGDALVLTSDPVKEPAFELLGTSAGAGKTLDITLDVPAALPLQLFSALVFHRSGTTAEVQFDQGPLRLSMAGAERPTKLALGFPVYEIASRPYDIPADVRAMHFRFVPNDLGKVAFDHQRLARDGDAFVLQRFGRTLRFVKEAPGEGDAVDHKP